MTVERLIELYGDQAYHKGVDLMIVALNAGDPVECRETSTATRELMVRGYHKNERVHRVPPQIETAS